MHISPDSPTLVLPTQQPDSAPSQEHASTSATKTIRYGKQSDVTPEMGKLQVDTPVAETRRTDQDTNIRSAEKPRLGMSPVDNKVGPEVGFAKSPASDELMLVPEGNGP